jgi:asparagine synthase (glutamine-hydrolysing)
MAEALAHRGPDGEGVWNDGPVALGHRRLAVIDLSQAAAQPLANEDGSVRVVFNGEIYNFGELRNELERKGHVFRSNSDTEVIVHQYEEDGDRCVEKFRGMFAFAIWDAKKRRLFAARDRAGKKPFVYAVAGGCFHFASEIRALAAIPRIPRALDPEALDFYLHYQYIPAPLSIWKDVRKLPPGHTLSVENGQVRVAPYWRLEYRLKDGYASPAEAEERFRSLLDESVRLRLVGDVPLGAFLSGGIDSAAVVDSMARQSGGRVRTFSIGFEESAWNELPAARKTANRLGTDHREQVVRPDALEVLPKLVRAYGEPFADSSAIPTYYVSKMACEHVTVALSGDGGDESFLGYARVAAVEAAATLARLPAPVRSALAAAARLLPQGASPRSLPRRIRRFLSLDGDTAERHFVELVAYFGAARRRALYAPEFAAQIPGDSSAWMERLMKEAPANSLTERTLFAEASAYLPEDLLVKVDIASMMNSLEVRAPLLDHTILEFAARLPLRFKKDGLSTKSFLKRALAPRLPAEVFARPKQGFGVPLEKWFRGELRDFSRDLLLSAQARQRGLFRESEVKRYLDEHDSGAADHSSRLWALVFFETWARENAL